MKPPIAWKQFPSKPWALCLVALGMLPLGAYGQRAGGSPPLSAPAVGSSISDLQQAHAAADAAYKAHEHGNLAEAVRQARRAVQLAPRNAQYARLLMVALAAAASSQEAIEAADQVLALAPGDVHALSERGRLRADLGDRPGARQDLEEALAAPGEPLHHVELAYLALRVDRPELAVAAFERADQAGRLPSTALRDAGFAAQRAGRTEQAASYFRRSVDEVAAGRLALTPQAHFESRRSHAELTRRWGLFASLDFRDGGGLAPGFGAAPRVPIGQVSQAGMEAWWRPFGQDNGRYAEVFARAFQTLDHEGGASGPSTRQTGIGVRAKPFTAHNLVLSLSRVDTRATGEDWLVQAAYSLDVGSDIRRDANAWWTTRLYAETGRYMRRNQNYAVAAGQFGRSLRLHGADHASILFPHVALAAEYDSAAVRNHSAGFGPGLALRQWFRGDRHSAPRSYLDIGLQYRFHLSGGERIKGWFASALLAY